MMPRNQERNQEITRRYIVGESLSTLANVFGVDKALIWRIAVGGGAPRYSHKQRISRRPSSGKTLTAWSETKTIAEWVKDARCQEKSAALYERINLGWSPEKAISTRCWQRTTPA